MASPQIENGFTRLANEILDHLVLPGINGSEYRIAILVLRKTYGFSKKKDKISLTQFQKGTSMKRAHVVETIKSLVDKRILLKEGNSYVFNKNWEDWVVHKRVPSTQKCTTLVHKRVPKVVHKSIHTKESIKETNTKEIAEASSAPFSLKEEIQKLEDNPRRDLNIIALYLEEKKPDLKNKAQLQVAIKRHLRAAKSLVPFTDNQIIDAVLKAKRITEDFTLETLVKVLTK